VAESGSQRGIHPFSKYPDSVISLRESNCSFRSSSTRSQPLTAIDMNIVIAMKNGRFMAAD